MSGGTKTIYRYTYLGEALKEALEEYFDISETDDQSLFKEQIFQKFDEVH